MAEKPKIVVAIKGNRVVGVTADTDADVLVLNLDTGSASSSAIRKISGPWYEYNAIPRQPKVEVLPNVAKRLFEQANAEADIEE